MDFEKRLTQIPDPYDIQQLSKLKAVLSPGIDCKMSLEDACFTDSNGHVVCSINSDGLDIIKPLVAGQNLGGVLMSLVGSNSGEQEKIKQQYLVFLRRLSARRLIQITCDDKLMQIPYWDIEPVTDAHLFITHKCNLDCIHCLITESREQELSIRKFTNVVDELIILGCTDLEITGGEITIKKGFLDLIEYAKSRSLAVGIATNGTNWTEDEFTSLIDLQPERVNISIYSANPCVHDTITQQQGSFHKSTQIARKLVQAGIPVNLKCMIMKENYDSYGSVATLGKDLGADYQLDPHITCELDGNPRPLTHRLNLGQLREFIASKPLSGRGIKNLEPTTTVCNAGVDRISINAYGDVHPCVIFPIKVGNVTEQALVDIWRDSDILNKIRKLKIQDIGQCGSCNLINMCSPCPGVSYLEHGDYHNTPKWCCDYTNILMKGGELPDGSRKQSQL